METLFRIMLPVIIIVFAAHRGYYVRKHGSEENTLKKRDEGLASKIAGILGLIGFISALMYAVKPGWLSWAAIPIPIWLRWVGMGIAGVCPASAGTEYARQELERHTTHDQRTVADHQRTVPIHQASHLHSVPSHSGFNAVHFRKLARWRCLDWHDCT